MFDGLKKIFKAPAPETTAKPSPEQAWSEQSMYRGADFPKYNPDALLSRKGYGIYAKMMTDEQVKAVVRFKRDAITSRDWSFTCDHKALSDEERAARVELFTKILGKIEAPFTDELNGIMSAMYNGFSMSEKVYKQVEIEGKTWYGIKRIKVKPADTFYFHTDEYGNIEKVTQKFGSKEQTLDIKQFVHFVQNPDQDEHYGRSELRECYRAWFSKDMTIKFQNIHLERFAAGFVWAAPVAGKSLVANSPEYLSLQAALSNLQATSSLILPSGIELNIEHPATTDAFERAVAQHDKSIAKALLVPNLMGISEQGSVGAYAQSQTQLETFLWTLDADATRLESVINTQVVEELGELNYGDGMYPTFKFKPVSDTKKLEIIKLFLQLVTAGAVKVTDLDETWLRETLEMPKKEKVEDDAPDLVLNGAQIETLVDIVSKVGKGELSPESAKAIIVAAFPMTEEQAGAMVDNAMVEKPEPETIDIDPVTGLPVPAKVDPATGKPVTKPVAKPDPAAGELEETLVGKMGISVSAFSKAIKRVDFAVIANKADNNIDDTVYALAKINSAVVNRLVALAEELKLGTAEGDPDDVRRITYTPAEVSKLKTAAGAGLQGSWDIGEGHARKELSKAKGAAFAVNDLALQDAATKYLKAKSYTLAGDISGATQKRIQNILMEGIKVSKTAAEVKRAIYLALEADGLLDDEAVAEALGAGTVKNASARIDTAIRTTSFEAINEARYQTFSDPDLEGFVEALEYSAILDDRTTEICSQLDGQTYGIDDEVWSTFRPPNHFNCRSLLIPVTQADTGWAQSEAPTVNPQKGFGFNMQRPAHNHAHEFAPVPDKVLTALADNQKALTEAVVAMCKGEKHFTINIDNKQGASKRTIKLDEATGNYVMTEENDHE